MPNNSSSETQSPEELDARTFYKRLIEAGRKEDLDTIATLVVDHGTLFYKLDRRRVREIHDVFNAVPERLDRISIRVGRHARKNNLSVRQVSNVWDLRTKFFVPSPDILSLCGPTATSVRV